MDNYLSLQKPQTVIATSNRFTAGGARTQADMLIVPPLNTDIRFSDLLKLHMVSEDDAQFTPSITIGANTPYVDLSHNLPLHSVTFDYNPREHEHLSDSHPHAFHIHTSLPEQFSWCLSDFNDERLIKIKKSLIAKPKAQHACGSCFAICMAQVFSDCLVVSGAVGWAPDISETWLMANLPARAQGGCGGGNPAVIAPILEDTGVLDSSCIDYSWCENDHELCTSMSSTQHFDAKSLAAKLNSKIPKNGCWFPQKKFLYRLDKGSRVFFINPEAPVDVFRKTVKTHLLDFGPAIGGYVVLRNFMSGAHTNPALPTKGVYFEKANYDGWPSLTWSNSVGAASGLHAVAIVGWGVEHDVEYGPNQRGTVPYWHCRNSWGENWGYQKGLFKMAMYPFNTHSQFDKEVMTSLGGPVGSMVLVRATQHPTVVNAEQVEEKYRMLKRTHPDLYYKAEPEKVVLYNRKQLAEVPLPVNEPSSIIAPVPAPSDETTENEPSRSTVSVVSTNIIIIITLYMVVIILTWFILKP